MLRNMGTAAWGAFPQGTDLQILNGNTPGVAGSSAPTERLMYLADLACDLLFLGQTLTSEEGMKISPDEIEVFAKSSNQDNPYKVGASEELHGDLYCERVLQTDSELLVPNALKDDEWKDNPDVALSMISYCGLPLHWPDGSHFETICILDRKENSYTETFRSLLASMRDSVENSLELIEALELKDNILGVAAHDLRSPLAEVESLTQLMLIESEESSDPDPMVPQLIHNAVAGMRELVDQLLKVQEVEAFKDQFRNERFDLCILLEACFAEIAAALKAKEQTLTHQPLSQLSVLGSPIYIKYAIRNLISNAFH